MNSALDRVIADDETGFKGSDDVTYRTEGWDFILAGGGIYDNLDYSFTPDHEDGTAKPDAPGGGGRTLRKQLAILKDFLHGFDFVRMTPDNSVIQGGLPPKTTARALVEKGKQYAVYINGPGVSKLDVELPAGRYQVQWINTLSGAVDKAETIRHDAGRRSLDAPDYSADVALSIRRVGG